MSRRDCTTIKLTIMVRLQRGPVGLDSRKLGSLKQELGTDSETFQRAIQDLLHRGLVVIEPVSFDRYTARLVKLTDQGKQLTQSAAQLI